MAVSQSVFESPRCLATGEPGASPTRCDERGQSSGETRQVTFQVLVIAADGFPMQVGRDHSSEDVRRLLSHIALPAGCFVAIVGG